MSTETAPQEQTEPPLTIRHGQQLANRIAKTHEDVEVTKRVAVEIKEILSPSNDEPSPVLQALEMLLEAQMQHTAAVRAMDERLVRIEKALRIALR